MKKFVRFILIVLGVAIFACAIFVFSSISNKKDQLDIFYASMDEFCDAITADDVDADKIDELAGTINSGDDYGYVEQAAKTYLRDIFIPYITALELEKTSVFKAGITKEIISTEQPEFKDSLQAIDDMEDAISVMYMAVADGYFSQEGALQYLDEDFDDYYIGLFSEQVEEVYSNEEMMQDYQNYYYFMHDKCVAYRAVIQFLIANNGSWRLDGDTVAFKTTALTNQYNELLAKVQK